MGPNEKADACLQKAQQVGARHVLAAHEMEETGAVWLVPLPPRPCDTGCL